MVDKDSRIVYYNRGAGRMFGFTGKETGPLSLADICPKDNPLSKTAAGFFLPHPPVEEQNEAFFQRADGERFYTIFSSSLFSMEGREPTLLLVIKDIHNRYISEERVSKKNRSLEVMAITDPLTGLYNRRHLDRRLNEEFKRLSRSGGCLTLVMLDFDHFKNINDIFGHLTGDRVLKTAAKTMAKVLRQGDTLARWGGEEFMALLPQTEAGKALAVVRRLHQTVGEKNQWAKLEPGLEVTVSMGLVSLPWADGNTTTIEQALEILDQALYTAKDSGRNRIVRYLGSHGLFEVV